eukprot:RCo032596
MVLFAAHLSHNPLFVFEPDFGAFSALKANIHLNLNVGRRIHAYHRCIADRDGTMTLFSRDFGDSTASLLAEGASELAPSPSNSSAEPPHARPPSPSPSPTPAGLRSTTVRCTTLPGFVLDNG